MFACQVPLLRTPRCVPGSASSPDEKAVPSFLISQVRSLGGATPEERGSDGVRADVTLCGCSGAALSPRAVTVCSALQFISSSRATYRTRSASQLLFAS